MNKRSLYTSRVTARDREGYGMMSKGNKGAYRSKKCRVRRNKQHVIITIREAGVQGLMETEAGFLAPSWVKCCQFHQVLGVVQNAKAGMDAPRALSVIASPSTERDGCPSANWQLMGTNQ